MSLEEQTILLLEELDAAEIRINQALRESDRIKLASAMRSQRKVLDVLPRSAINADEFRWAVQHVMRFNHLLRAAVHRYGDAPYQEGRAG